jgi:hypothetical protein
VGANLLTGWASPTSHAFCMVQKNVRLGAQKCAARPMPWPTLMAYRWTELAGIGKDATMMHIERRIK